MKSLLIAAFAALAFPAFAQERIVDATPTLDAEIILSKAAERQPTLMEFLRDDAMGLLADMKSLAAEEAADLGASFHQHTLRITDDDRLDTGGFISLVRNVGTFTGGAHGNLQLEPLTWDASARNFVRLDGFFKPGLPALKALEAIALELRKILKARHGKDYETWKNDVLAATMPDVTVMQNFTLEPATAPGKVGGLAFHYSPYEVGPFSMGPVRVMIPQAVFAAGLRTEFKSLFSGSPR